MGTGDAAGKATGGVATGDLAGRTTGEAVTGNPLGEGTMLTSTLLLAEMMGPRCPGVRGTTEAAPEHPAGKEGGGGLHSEDPVT